MKSQDLLDAWGQIDASMILEAEPKESEVICMTRKRRHIKPIIFVAAAMLIAATLSVAAVAQSAKNDMEPYWEQVFVTTTEKGNALFPSTDATETLDADAAQKLDNISATPEDLVVKGTSDDVKFNVIGVTGAGGVVYVWLEFTLSDALMQQIETLGEVEGIFDHRFDCKINGSGSGGMSLNYLGTKAELLGTDRLAQYQKYATNDWSGSAQTELVATPDNTFCWAVRIHCSTLYNMSGKKLTMNIQNLVCRIPDAADPDKTKYVTLAEGEWELNMTLNYEESRIIYYPSVRGTSYVADIADESKSWFSYKHGAYLTEATLQGCLVEISPISVKVSLSFVNERLGGALPVVPKTAILVMADGTQREVIFSGKSGSIPGGAGAVGNVSVTALFDEPIDHTQAVAVIFNGITLPLDSTMPE